MSRTTVEERPFCSSHYCCISHEFFKSASQNPNKIAVIHATGGLQLCQDLSERRLVYSDDAVVEEWCRKCRESSSPSLYKGDLGFTYGEILASVDSLSRRIRQILDYEDLIRPGVNLHARKRLDAQKIGVSDNYGRFPHIVGVNIGPSVEYIVAVLSILRCGEAFLPLDPLWPEERIASITSSSNTSLVIKCNHSSHSVGGFQQDEPDRVVNCACSVLQFSMQRGLFGNVDQPELVWPCRDKNPRLFSYLMYTSGSTGKPKGVCGTEKGLSNRFVWMQDLYPLLKDDVLLFKTSISFIDHIQEFLGAILTCTPIVVPPFNELKENPFYLVDILKVYNISRLVTVPSLMRAFIPILQSSTSVDIHSSLKLLVLSGEIFSISLWKVLCKLLPNTTILNLYGTTEVSGDCTYFDCKNLPKLLDTEIVSSVPIGIPIINCDAILHGDHQNYEEGEIHVSGSCLFLGYLDDFYHGLYKKCTGSQLFFSTGDFAKRLKSGDIVIVGRNDRIVKINGQRIALDEIENALIEHPDVDAAAVTFHGNLSNPSNLKAYIVQKKKPETQVEKITLDDNQHVDEGLVFSIKSWLLKKFPLGMLPGHYICIDKLPLCPSGKIDYSLLENSVSMQNKRRMLDEDKDFRDHLKIIKEIFCNALQVEEIEDGDDFFSLGGNSISAAQVAFKLAINMKLLYLYSSPFELLNILIKPPHNFLTSHGKRLKLKDTYFSDGEDRHKNKIISKDKIDSSSSGLISMEIPPILRLFFPKDDSSWFSIFPEDSRYSFSRSNKFIDGNGPSLNSSNDARYILEMTSREDFFMQELWKVSLDSCVDASPLLILRDGYFHLIIGSHAHLLLCVNAQTGDIRWEIKLEDRIECSAAVTGDFSQIVVGCFKGNIYFIDIMTGHISWVFQTYGEVKMQPVAYKHLMWCGSHDHMLYALDHRKQCCVFKISCGGSIYGSPIVDEVRNMLYVATTNGHVTAISVKDLSFHTVWLYKSEVPIFGSLCLHASSGNVICCLVDGHVVSLDLKGSLLWKVSTGGPIFSAACMSSVLPSQVLICSRSGSVYSFEVEGGGLLWEYDMGNPITASAYVDEHIQLPSKFSGPPDRLVCICSSSGSIHVLRVNSRSSQAEHSQSNTSPEKIACFALPGNFSGLSSNSRSSSPTPTIMLATTASIPTTRNIHDQVRNTGQTETETFIFRSKFPDIEIPNGQPLHTYCFEKLPEIADKPCLIDGSDSGRMYTFAETHLLCRKTAAGLKRLGIKRGDSVMVLLQNCPEFVFTFMASSMIGAVITGANPYCTSNEIKKQLVASGARIVVTESKYVEKLPFEGETIVVIDAGDVPSGCRRFSSEFIDAGGDVDFDVGEILINADDPVALPFSSGTTGLPKGVVLTHKNLITSIAQQVDGENPNVYVKPNDVVLCVLPLFHIFSLNSVLLCSIRSGCTVLLMKKFEIILFLELIQKHHVSIALVVPPLVLALTKNPKVENYDLSSIRMVHCGAAPLGKELEKTLRERLPQAIFGQGYGMTEAGPVLTMCPTFAKHPFPSKSGSCGTIVRNAELKIVDPETNVSLRRNQPGEICIRGEEIMKGYLNDPEATARTIDTDGWLHTGDIGYVDDDDEVFIVDRMKELIKVKGFQVPPAELESLLIGNPGISDAAVVAQKDEVSGEVPVAFVVRSEIHGQDLIEDDVKSFISKQVIFYKRLHKVYFIASIPKSPSGKILRRKLQTHK